MTTNNAIWFGAGFVSGAAYMLLVELIAYHIIPYCIEAPHVFDNNLDEDNANVDDGPNQEQRTESLLPDLDNRQPVVYTYDETGPTAYLQRTLQRSRHKSNRASPHKTLGKSTERDSMEVTKGDVIVTVTEVKDDDDQATISPPAEPSYKGKGKAPARESSPPLPIDSVLPTKVDKGKAKALADTATSTDMTPLSSKRVSFHIDGGANMTKQEDVTGNGEGSSRAPTAFSPVSAQRTHPGTANKY